MLEVIKDGVVIDSVQETGEQSLRVELAGRLAPPELLSPAAIAALLPKLEQIGKWVKEVQEYALTQAVEGVKYEGYKVVAGKSNRRYTTEDGVAEALIAEGYDENVIYEKKLKGLTKMEAILGKKKFKDLLEGLVEKPEGKPTLVPESDKRKALNTVEAAVADFDDEN